MIAIYMGFTTKTSGAKIPCVSRITKSKRHAVISYLLCRRPLESSSYPSTPSLETHHPSSRLYYDLKTQSLSWNVQTINRPQSTQTWNDVSDEKQITKRRRPTQRSGHMFFFLPVKTNLKTQKQCFIQSNNHLNHQTDVRNVNAIQWHILIG